MTVRNGTEYYAHTAITPVLVAPGETRVLVLEPEFIQPQDGEEKQDCERNAGKRWLVRNGPRLARHGATVLGDDLCCSQPNCEQVLAQGLNFIFTCKADSHPALYEEVALLARLGAVCERCERRWTGQGHEIWIYRFVNDVPLRATLDALKVNWCELTIVCEETGELLYRNAFATNHRLTAQNVAALVKGAGGQLLSSARYLKRCHLRQAVCPCSDLSPQTPYPEAGNSYLEFLQP